MKAVILAATLALSATAANAQVRCGPHDIVFSFGATELGQYPSVHLLDAAGGEFVLLINEETGDWTIIRTDGHTACIMAAGTGVTPAGVRG